MRRWLTTVLFVVGSFLHQTPALAGTVPSLSVIGTIPGPDGGWDTVSVDAEARRLYIAHGDAVMAVFAFASSNRRCRLLSRSHK